MIRERVRAGLARQAPRYEERVPFAFSNIHAVLQLADVYDDLADLGVVA